MMAPLIFFFLISSGLSIPPSFQKTLSETSDSMVSTWFFEASMRPIDLYRAELSGARLRATSNWLGAVSMLLPPDNVTHVAEILNAAGVSHVMSLKAQSDEREYVPKNMPLYDPHDYGSSYDQVSTINAVSMHKNGFVGEGVVIGVFDTGFDSTHPAISHLWSGNRIVAHYDFASGDHIASIYGEIPLPYSGDIKFVNSMDVAGADSFFLIAYSMATENDLAAFPYVKNKWRIGVTIGQTELGHAFWNPLPPVVRDSFAISPSISYQSGLIYLAYQAKEINYDFNIKFIKFDTLGHIYVGPLRISNTAEAELVPQISVKGDTVWIFWATTHSVNVAVSTNGGSTFETTGSFEVTESGQVGGSDLVSYRDRPIFIVSINNRILFATPDSLLNLSFQGVLPSAISTDSLIHLVYAEGDTIKYIEINSLQAGVPRTVAQGFSGIKPAVWDDNGEIKAVYTGKGGALLSISLSNGHVDTLANTLTDFVSSNGNFLAWRQRGDSDIYPQNYIPHSGTSQYHGTKVLSVIGGFYQSRLIGVAPGANFILARTEKTTTSNGVNFENQIEEDFWIEALEWAAAHGVNIVSSSLGYADWYRRSDMDGRTAPISRAASEALGRNILVVNAMGNVRHQSFPDPQQGDTTLVAPADAEGIIAVGSYEVDSVTGELLPPSGALGPTADGRIKPEVIAPYWVFTASDRYLDDDTTFVAYFLYSAGTSYGTALVSGGAALVWQAHPDWTAAQVREAILDNAKPVEIPGYPDAPIPNNIVGWGLIDVAGAAGVGEPGQDVTKKDKVLTPYPSPARYGQPIVLRFNLFHVSDISFYVYTLSGELLKEIHIPGESYGYNELTWDGLDDKGNPLPPGLYILVMVTNNSVSTTKFAVR